MSEKLFFELDVEDGYPPVAEEILWVEKLDNSLLRIDNIPFYTKEVSLGDIVSYTIKDGVYYFNSIVKHSDNLTIRVVFLKKTVDIDEIYRSMEKCGCEIEKMYTTFWALSVKTLSDFEKITFKLEELESQHILDFELGKLSFEVEKSLPNT